MSFRLITILFWRSHCARSCWPIEAEVLSAGWSSGLSAVGWNAWKRWGCRWDECRSAGHRWYGGGDSCRCIDSTDRASNCCSGIGIVGVFFFIRFFFFDVPYLKKFKVKRTSYIIAIVVYFLLNLLNSKELAPFCYSSIVAIAICFCVIFSHTQLDRKSVV